MKISFHGAARTVTGSKHLLHFGNKKVLLDCGMFQGMGKETLELNSQWGFDPLSIDAVIISHAHIDHIGLLPKLVKDGFQGKIYMTPATSDLAELMLADSAHIQESDVSHINKQRKKTGRELVEALYTEEDALDVIPLIVRIPYYKKYEIFDDLELHFVDCGHILGSTAVNLKIIEDGKSIHLTFSGDIGRYRDIILRSPDVFPQADVIIMESTYGNKHHEFAAPPAEELYNIIQETCINRKGKVIIPAFSVGRTQEILYALNRLEQEGRLPPVPYYVDSPLSSKVTRIVRNHPEVFNKTVKKLLEKDEDVFNFKGLKMLIKVEDSIALNSSKNPMVIISASGMAEAGRVKHHIAHNIHDPNSTILMVGYSEPRSLGGRLKSGAKTVGIFGQQYDVKAEVRSINSMSAHGDVDDLSQWLACQNPAAVKKLFIVHGEYDVQQEFRNRLLKKGFTDVQIPDLHEEFGMG